MKFKTKVGKYEEIKGSQPSPQNRQRVYFTCHPDDFDKYFDEITNEILSRQPNNTCIYFYDEEAENEERDLDLNQMILFVIPVTYNFIRDDNCQARKDFKFAEENNISMLLLQQDYGLEEEFNRKCGNYQMLSKFPSLQNSQFYDPTAITYEEKLTKYLESKIIGDELVKEIQNAFDAYIFLSYRKKDRKYAQELMKLIHNNDFCRDIAIWYDEFLVSGEDFNEAIMRHMNESGLFAMVVTPNLVNEENYVQSTEYPAAVEAKKPVFPAESVPTDSQKLKELYPDIPDTVDTNGADFSKELLNTIHKIAIKENDKDPKHNYLIGLAYLNGICVEKDTEKAINLFISAAESGLPEAMRKLYEIASDYYRHNNLKIGHKLIETLNNIYDNWESEFYKNGISLLGDIFNDKAELLNLWGLFYLDENPNKSKDFFNKSISRSINIQTEESGEVLQPKIAMKYANLALSHYNSGKYDEAEKYYCYAIEKLKPYVLAISTLKTRCDNLPDDLPDVYSFEYELAYCYSSLARVYVKIKETEQAEKYYTEALNILHTITERTFNREAEISTIHTCEEIGNLYRNTGFPDKAEEYNLDAISRIEKIYDNIVDSEYCSLYTFLCNNLANIYYRKGMCSEAEIFYTKALTTLENANDVDNNAELQINISMIKVNLANISFANGNLEVAKSYYLESLNHFFEMQKKGEPAFYFHIAMTSRELGKIYTGENDFDNAIKYLSISKDSFLLQNQVNGYDNEIADICADIGEIHLNNSHYEEAEPYYFEALKHYKSAFLAGKESETIIADTESSIAFLYFNMGRLDEAETYYKDALNIYVKQEESMTNFGLLSDIARVCNGMGVIYQSKNDFDLAEKYLLKAFEIRFCLAETNSGYIRYTNMTYENLITLYNSKKEYDKIEELKLAVDNFETAMAFVEKYLK